MLTSSSALNIWLLIKVVNNNTKNVHLIFFISINLPKINIF